MVMGDGSGLLDQDAAEHGINVGPAGTQYIGGSLREVLDQVDSVAVLGNQRPRVTGSPVSHSSGFPFQVRENSAKVVEQF